MILYFYQDKLYNCAQQLQQNRTHNNEIHIIVVVVFESDILLSWTMKAEWSSFKSFDKTQCCLYQKWFSSRSSNQLFMRCFTNIQHSRLSYLHIAYQDSNNNNNNNRSLTIFKLEQTSNSLQLLIIYNTWNPIKLKTFSRVTEPFFSISMHFYWDCVCFCVCVTLNWKHDDYFVYVSKKICKYQNRVLSFLVVLNWFYSISTFERDCCPI